MSSVDLLVLTPLIVAALAGVAVMLAGGFGARRESLHGFTVAAVAAALASIALVTDHAPHAVTTLLIVDRFTLLFWVLTFASVGIVAIVSRPYLAARDAGGEAYYSLLLFAAVGMGVLAAATHFASFFLGLETLTVSLYVLLGHLRGERASLEAAAKYLILAAMASAILLFGIALLYAATGSLQPAEVAAQVGALLLAGDSAAANWAVFGSLMLLCGFAFKLALVPFHLWSPDVYQGAPAPITALIATGSKGAVIAALVRMLAAAPGGATGLGEVLGALAMVTMLAGNVLALLQTDVKRLLAYSSVAHIGYVTVALAAGGAAGSNAAVFYTVTYVIATLGTFGVVSVLSAPRSTDIDDLADWRGLGRRRPLLAAVFSVMLLALAGIPPTGGFLAKFAVLSAAIAAGRIDLAVVMVIASAIAIYYYLRLLAVMYMTPDDEATSSTDVAPATPIGSIMALATLTLAVLAIGVHPDPWLRAVELALASVGVG